MSKALKPTQVAVDHRAWQADTVDDRAAWYQSLPEEFVAELRAHLAGLAPEPRAVKELWITGQDRARWSRHLASARRTLEAGRGFVILERLPVEGCSQRESTALYWLIGQLLGDPVQQNVEGTLLYDVRDTGQNVAAGARFSVTNYESSFHTDNSFGATIVDYVGLLCLRTAKLDGLSQMVSGYAAHDVLLRENPDVLKTLFHEFHVDRRGGLREGESPTVRHPVFARLGPGLIIRYLRYWIEAGHEKVGQPLTPAQRHALDVFDDVLRRPELRAEFSLDPGQMYFINNRWILHNRTDFFDYPEPERQRHLVRLWLQARSM
ncbi:MAG TPA: TauD/TfdA family dioxygenase [Pirellulales bacterium]|nr:TauD/TfdA family dioxygenase [Pirellulales bacterium]